MCFYGWMGSGSKEWLLRWMQVARPKESRKKIRAKKTPKPHIGPGPGPGPAAKAPPPPPPFAFGGRRLSYRPTTPAPLAWYQSHRRHRHRIQQENCFSTCFSLSTEYVAPFKFRDQHCLLSACAPLQEKKTSPNRPPEPNFAGMRAHEQLSPSCPPSFRPKRKRAPGCKLIGAARAVLRRRDGQGDGVV